MIDKNKKPVGLPTENIKKKFGPQRIPLAQDFADLINIADCGRKALGLSPDQEKKGPGPGLTTDNDDRLAVKPDVTNVVKVGEDGVGIRTGVGLNVIGESEKTLVVGSPALIVGMIILFKGEASALQNTGWFLCDGNHGTPDLTGRFVLGCNTYKSENKSPDSVVSGSGSYERKYERNTDNSTAGGTISGSVASTTLQEQHIPSHYHTTGVRYFKDELENESQGAFAREGYAKHRYVEHTNDNGANFGVADLGERWHYGTGKPLGEPKTSDYGGGEGHTHVAGGLSFTGTQHVHSVNILPPYYELAYIMYKGLGQ